MTKFLTCLLILHLFCTTFMNAQGWREWKLRSAQSLKQYDIATAAVQLEKALKLLQKEVGADSPLLDSMTVQLSDLYSVCMRYEAALPLLRKTISAREKGRENTPEYFHALTNLAGVFVYYENYDTAYLLLKNFDSLRMKSDAGDKFLQAENLMIFSRYYTGIANLDSALACSSQAAILYKSIKDKYLPELSLASSTSAYLCMQLGNLQMAEQFVTGFKDLMTSAYQGYHPYFMETQINYAECLAMKGRLKEARDLYTINSVLIGLKLGMDNPLAITCYNNQGYNFLRMDSIHHARKQFAQALFYLKKKTMEESMMYFITKNNEGMSYMFTRQFTTADSIFDSVLSLAEKKWGKQHNLYQTTLYNKAMACSYVGKLDEAAKAFIGAGNIYKIKILTDMSGMPENEQLNMYNMSEIYFQVMPSFLHLNKGYRKDTILRALYSEQSFLKGLISHNQQKVLSRARNSGDASLSEQLNKWVTNRQLLSEAYSRNQSKKNTDSLSLQTDLLERAMRIRSKYFNQAQNDVAGSYAAISNKLKKNEVAIEFIKYRLFNENWTDSVFYAAMIIDPASTAPFLLDLCTESELLKLLQPYYRDSLARNHLYRLYKNPLHRKPGRLYGGDSLFRLVWKPLEKYLANKTTVYLSPIALLNLVAFPALPYNKTRLLADRYKIHRLQHLSALLTKDNDTPAAVKNIELWGAIDYDHGGPANKPLLASGIRSGTERWDSLPYAKKEIDDIKRIFEDNGRHVRLFKDTMATRERFITTVNNEPYILHIATHGFYKEDTSEQSATRSQFYSYNISKSRNPLLRSGLVFAGANVAAEIDSSLMVNSAILSSFDIASLDLENVQLVTLSACETALGDLNTSEGVFGLQRALKVAGVEKMILTLWRVDDEKTQIFMKLFYNKLVSGLSIPTAFAETQQTLRKTMDPQDWAGYILVE